MLNQLNIMEVLKMILQKWLIEKQLIWQLHLCHPIMKLLVSINQSSYLIYSIFSTDLNSKETSIYHIEEAMFADNHVLVE